MSKIQEENVTDPLHSTLQVILSTPIPNQSSQLEVLKDSIARSHEESLNTPVPGDAHRVTRNKLSVYARE